MNKGMTRGIPLLLALVVGDPCAGQPTGSLMPVPRSVTWGEGSLMIDSSFSVSVKGEDWERVSLTALRTMSRLSRETGIPMRISLEESLPATLQIVCKSQSSRLPALGDDESYKLLLTKQYATLTAATYLGVVRGVETFLQLVRLTGSGFAAPVVEIHDSPRFPWRGLLIDVCRHWIPIDVLKRTIDGMAAVKMNVLHWHVSEDQGFRIESKTFPLLHQMGSDGYYYSQDQVREVIQYAAERGIRVVPEFDVPGHATSWLVGYPALASMPGPYTIERRWGIHDPTMDPTNEFVYSFLDTLIDEMASLFPDKYFHIGGDEVNGKHWNASASITAFKEQRGMKDNHDLQVYFNKRVSDILKKNGKTMVGWDEILHPDLPNDIVVQSWRGQKALAAAVQRGSFALLSWGYYLDHIRPASYHYSIDPLGGDASVLSQEQEHMVLGGEACMWAEFVTPENIDSRLWPRTAAIAERFWSPQSVNDTEDMYRRLSTISKRLEWLDLTHRSSYALMLQRLTGDYPINHLQILSDVIEPVKFYDRPRTRKYTQQTPLHRLVDATRPESEVARLFAGWVEKFLADSTRKECKSEIRNILSLWKANHEMLQPVLEKSSLLTEVIPLSQSLSELAEAGLKALNHIEAKTPNDSIQQALSLVGHGQLPTAELLLMITPSIQRLILASGE